MHRRLPRRETVFTGILLGTLITVVAWILRGTVERTVLLWIGSVFIVNCALVIAMLTIFYEQPEHAKALQTHQVFGIANETIQHLRKGLTVESATQVAKIVLREGDAIAVAITDRSKVLGFAGSGEDHHSVDQEIMTAATRRAIEYNATQILGSNEDIGCPVPGCPLQSAIVIPLELKGAAAGTLKFYYSSADKLTESRIAVAEGLGRLLSTQLEVSEVEKQRELTYRAELRALQAQINPHFLFNTLNTITMFCRTDPGEARRLLIQFSNFFRKSLEHSDEMITLKQELEYVNNYLVLERARFGNNLHVIEDVQPAAEKVRVPAFLLQPLVENSIKHGLPETGTLKIRIRAHAENGSVKVAVEDDGRGMTQAELSRLFTPGFAKGLGIGLRNVNERLKATFGPNNGLKVTSTPNVGTSVSFEIPYQEGQVNASSAIG